MTDKCSSECRGNRQPDFCGQCKKQTDTLLRELITRVEEYLDTAKNSFTGYEKELYILIIDLTSLLKIVLDIQELEYEKEITYSTT